MRLKPKPKTICKWTLNHLAKLAKWFSCCEYLPIQCIYDYMFSSCHIAFQSESTLYNCLNVKKLLARNRRDIWNLSDGKGFRICNRSVRERISNHLTKLASLAKCLNVRLRIKWLWVRIPLVSFKVIYLRQNITHALGLTLFMHNVEKWSDIL